MRRSGAVAPTTVCFGIGYQGRSLADFCQALVDAEVSRLIDVRERAWSHRPEFRKGAMSQALEEHGIEYVHCKEAGNPHRPRAGEQLSAKKCLALYSAHLDEHPAVLVALTSLMQGHRAALFCYESTRDQCHRGVLMAALVAQDAAVELKDL